MMSNRNKKRKRVNAQKRIDKLKEEANRLCGGKMSCWEPDSDKLPPEILESFWEGVVNYEKTSYSTFFKKLSDSGFELLPPESMDDGQLADKLSKLILCLAQMNAFIYHTDHLSDRELYRILYCDALHEEIADFAYDEGGAFFLDLIGSGSDEHINTYLKYYAGEEERSLWTKEFPGDDVPRHEDPPYDRDSQLPKL